MKGASLRARLLILIMAPLMVVAAGLGLWRYQAALATAEELFDRALLSAGLAVSRDIALTGGDALSVITRDQLRAAAGGEVFYHASGPDLAYLTGYAYPPVPPRGQHATPDAPLLYEARHRGELVRALRVVYLDAAPPIQGLSTVTVWQRGAERSDFAQDLASEAALALAILVAAVAAIVWFGVDRGLRPLADLQSAISARSSDDLSGIRRPVPREVRGVVATLNALFGQVRGALEARDAFISDAAHQLRNPAAAIQTLSEAAERANHDPAVAARLSDLSGAAARLGRLTNQLLSLETLRAGEAPRLAPVDFAEIARETSERAAARALSAGYELSFDASGPAPVMGDALLLGEALENLIDNALRHGPPALTRIAVTVRREAGRVIAFVADDGVGLAPEDQEAAFARFGQIGAAEGSGLGLAIALRIVELHGGALRVEAAAQGARIALDLPLSDQG